MLAALKEAHLEKAVATQIEAEQEKRMETKSLPIGPQQTSGEFFAGHRFGYSAFVSVCWRHGHRVRWSIQFSRVLDKTLAYAAVCIRKAIESALVAMPRHRSQATVKESTIRSTAKRKLYKAQQTQFEKRQRLIQAGG